MQKATPNWQERENRTRGQMGCFLAVKTEPLIARRTGMTIGKSTHREEPEAYSPLCPLNSVGAAPVLSES